MKFNIILLFCLCFTSGLLTASSLDDNIVDGQENLLITADEVDELLPMTLTNFSLSIDDAEVCYSATISASVGGVLTAGITVEGCGATSAEAWRAFTSALGLARQER